MEKVQKNGHSRAAIVRELKCQRQLVRLIRRSNLLPIMSAAKDAVAKRLEAGASVKIVRDSVKPLVSNNNFHAMARDGHQKR